MKPIYQTKFGGVDAPEAEQGNCLAACLATIFGLGLEQVPDFTGEIVGGGWFFTLQRWLKARNLSILMLPSDAMDKPAGYSMAGVDSETLGPDCGHMVVMKNGQLAHDPNPRAKRSADDYKVLEYWAFTCVDPSMNRWDAPHDTP